MRRALPLPGLLVLLVLLVLLPAAAGATSALDAMLAADREFGRMSETRPVKEMFLSVLDGDSVLFRGGEPVPGKAWTEEQPSPPFKLFLRPAWAGIARSGELGWTADPYELHPDGSDEVHYGEYLTVWRKHLDGRWLFVVNFYVHTPGPEGAASEPKVATPGEGGKAASGKVASGKAIPAAEETAALLAADRELGEATAAGTSAAYRARLLDDGILMRNGTLAFQGKEAVRSALDKMPAKMASLPMAGGVSEAGDLGYSYGTADWTDGGVSVKAHYLRIWEKRDDAWKLKVDLVAEVPRPDPPKP
jgi:ketosteroid isomerase-like protein